MTFPTLALTAPALLRDLSPDLRIEVPLLDEQQHNPPVKPSHRDTLHELPGPSSRRNEVGGWAALFAGGFGGGFVGAIGCLPGMLEPVPFTYPACIWSAAGIGAVAGLAAREESGGVEDCVEAGARVTFSVAKVAAEHTLYGFAGCAITKGLYAHLSYIGCVTAAAASGALLGFAVGMDDVMHPNYSRGRGHR